MGQLIRRSAAAPKIVADVKAALAAARARGGVLEQLAEQQLGPVVATLDDVQARLAAGREALVPLRAAVRAKNGVAKRVVGEVADQVWNVVGRPAKDPALVLLFPGGIAHYVERDVSSIPDRLDLLARLLQMRAHPQLPDDVARAGAANVTKAGAELRAAVAAARAPQALVHQLERVARAIAASAHLRLSALKHLYLAAGLTEREIHAVIPERSRAQAPPHL